MDVAARDHFRQVVSRSSRSVWVGTHSSSIVVKLICSAEDGEREWQNRCQFNKICPGSAAQLLWHVVDEDNGALILSLLGAFCSSASSSNYSLFLTLYIVICVLADIVVDVTPRGETGTYPLVVGSAPAEKAAFEISRVRYERNLIRSNFAVQMVSRLAQAGWAYGDWKAENYAWIDGDDKSVVQAIDFGHMCRLGRRGPWGTKHCMAPEVCAPCSLLRLL